MNNAQLKSDSTGTLPENSQP